MRGSISVFLLCPTLLSCFLCTSNATRTSLADEAAEQQLRREFYAPDVVQQVELKVAPRDLQRMRDALPERIYVPGEFRWRDQVLGNVAVRYKGNSSSHPDQRHKRSFLVKFSEYDEETRFLGMERVSFDNGVQFGGLISEPVITDLLREMKVVTHRANYAKLFLNGEYHGVYVNVERIDQTFLDRHWGKPSKRALYKVHLGGPGANLQYLGEGADRYRAFEAKNKQARKHADELVGLLAAINRTPPEQLAAELERRLELDAFLKVTAVMLYSGAFDQLTGWNHHNYYLVHDRQQQRWTYLPWDLDVGFSAVAFERIQVLRDWNAAWPIPNGSPPNPLLQRIIDTPQLLERYRLTADQILEEHFAPEELTTTVDRNYALIKDALAEDPFHPLRVTNPRDRDYDDIVDSMKDFIRQRYALARQQLDNPGPRPKMRPPQPRNDPAPGDAPGAPTQLTVVSRAGNTVELQWQDNAQGEAGTILQRAVGRDGKFQNYRGFPGDKMTTAKDTNVPSDKVVRYRVYALFASPNGPRGSAVSNVAQVNPE